MIKYHICRLDNKGSGGNDRYFYLRTGRPGRKKWYIRRVKNGLFNCQRAKIAWLSRSKKARLSPSGFRVPVLHYHTRIFLIRLISQYYNILITKY